MILLFLCSFKGGLKKENEKNGRGRIYERNSLDLRRAITYNKWRGLKPFVATGVLVRVCAALVCLTWPCRG